MGLYDEYLPTPPLQCPHCAFLLSGWQGKDGPCSLLIWKQGERNPVGQNIDIEVRWPRERLVAFALPNRFEFYTSCGGCKRWIDVTGFCENETWTTNTFGRHIDSKIIDADAVVDDWRQCSGCADAWQQDPSVTLGECPSCHALTRLMDLAKQ